MSPPPKIKGPGQALPYDGTPLRIGIVHARWNTQIIDALLAGTLASLRAAGVRDENIVIQTVPGSYELPYAVQRMYLASQTQHAATAGGTLTSAATDLLGGSTTDLAGVAAGGQKKEDVKEDGDAKGSKEPFDAIIAIGALIKGSTMHFEYISDAVSHALMKVQMETGCAVVFGLLTLLTEEQGLERAGSTGRVITTARTGALRRWSLVLRGGVGMMASSLSKRYGGYEGRKEKGHCWMKRLHQQLGKRN